MTFKTPIVSMDIIAKINNLVVKFVVHQVVARNDLMEANDEAISRLEASTNVANQEIQDLLERV